MKLFWNDKSKDNLPGEKWVDAFGFDGIYEVSNRGRIRSLDRFINSYYGGRMLKGRVLSQCKTPHGKTFSLYVQLANGDGTYSNKTMASLILNSFKKPDKYNDCTHHINGISYDNRLKNLTFEDLSTKRKIEYDIGVRDGENNIKHWRESGHLDRCAESFEEVRFMRTGRTPKRREYRNKKPITVYIDKGKFIGTYTCIRNASEQLGIKEYTLRNALSKPHKYQYIQVKNGSFNMEEFNPKPKSI